MTCNPRALLASLWDKYVQYRYKKRLAWLQKNDVCHYALVEAGPLTEVLKWPKKKLLWMRDIDRYLARQESRITKFVEAEVRRQLSQGHSKK